VEGLLKLINGPCNFDKKEDHVVTFFNNQELIKEDVDFPDDTFLVQFFSLLALGFSLVGWILIVFFFSRFRDVMTLGSLSSMGPGGGNASPDNGLASSQNVKVSVSTTIMHVRPFSSRPSVCPPVSLLRLYFFSSPKSYKWVSFESSLGLLSSSTFVIFPSKIKTRQRQKSMEPIHSLSPLIGSWRSG